MRIIPFAELGVASNFSFLRGASHADESVLMAKELGLEAIGVADRNTLAGIVRVHAAAKAQGVRLLVGARAAGRACAGAPATRLRQRRYLRHAGR